MQSTRALLVLAVLSSAAAHAEPSAFLSATAFSAAQNTWEAVDLGGGALRDVLASPTRAGLVLAGGDPASFFFGNRLHRSTDAGETWTPASFGGGAVEELEFDCAGTAYAASQDGLWRSVDDGVTWTRLFFGPVGASSFVSAVAVDPSDVQQVWAGLDAPSGAAPSLLRSTDGGATWTNVTPPGGVGNRCVRIALDPLTPGFVVGLFDFGGIWVSTDGGATWADRFAGLPPTRLRGAAAMGGRLYVSGIVSGGSFYGAWASDDLGVTWTQLHDDGWPSVGLEEVVLDPSTPDRVLLASTGGGMIESLDAGATWEVGAGGTGNLGLANICVDPLVPGRLYLASSSAGAWRSDDDGASFVLASSGIRELNLTSVDRSPSNTEDVAIAFEGPNDGGVYTSSDGGDTWTLEPLPAARYVQVRFGPDGRLYAVSTGPAPGSGSGIYRRTGGAWTNLGPPLGPSVFVEPRVVYVSPRDPDLILCGGRAFSPSGAAIFRTVDGGASWTRVFTGLSFERVTDIEFVEDGTDTVGLAAAGGTVTQGGGGVLRTVDQGATWTRVTAGLPPAMQGRDISVSRTNPTRFYFASFPEGFFISSNSGQSWRLSSTSSGAGEAAADPYDPDRVFVSRSSIPLIGESRDGGVTFEDYGEGGADVIGVRELTLTRQGDELFAATWNGLYRIPTRGSIGVPVCSPAVPNSTGAPSTIAAIGVRGVDVNDLQLRVSGLPPQQTTLLLTGRTQVLTPNVGGSAGTLCIGGGIGRLLSDVQVASPTGSAEVVLDVTSIPTPNALVSILAGETWLFQAWHRDVGALGASNLSDAVAVTLE